MALMALLLGQPGCSSREPLDVLIRRLDDSTRREEAIHGLLQLVKKSQPPQLAETRRRVVNALMEAYRKDESRPEIVSALAAIGDPAGREVFVAALGDVDRGGTYFEAAVRSARALGELGLKQEVPALTRALLRAKQSPRPDRNTWLERAIIQSLVQLGDRRASDALIEILKTDPARQDFYLNKLAASALGDLGGSRAIRPLLAALASTHHGLLLFEECRRAICKIGPLALPELLAAASQRDRRGQPAPNAAAALRVLADIAEPGTVPQLTGLARPKDPLDYRLAVAEAMIRARLPEGEEALLQLLRDREASLTARRQAAELLGWYGGRASASAVLAASCDGEGPAQNVLCWSGALAYTRLAGPDGLETLSSMEARRDEVTNHYLAAYRARLVLAARCLGDQACWLEALKSSKDWRERERAALELGRIAAAIPAESDRAELALALAEAFRGAHAQVQEAILVALDKTGSSAAVAERVAVHLADQNAVEPAPASIASRALCEALQWRRRARERR